MPLTSYSEVSSYLQCKRRHYYNYIENLKRVQESEALQDGSIGHSVLETYYRHRMANVDHDVAVDLAYDTLKESGYVWDPEGRRADLEDMLFNYYFPNEPFAQQGYRILGVEKDFTLTWDDDPDEGYKFVVDLIMYSPQGDVVVVDHKFTAQFTDDNAAQLLPQIPLYIAGIRSKGLPADYGVYNEINMRKVQKKRPVSDAMRLMWMRPTGDRIVESFRQQVEVAREISERKQLPISVAGSTAWRVSNKMLCNMCSYSSLCIGELMGTNTNLIRRTEYTQRTIRTFELEVSNAET